MDQKNPDFKKLTLKQFETLVDWARIEGWNPGLSDARIFFDTDPDGHYGLFIEDEMIGGGSLVSYSGLFGFMGLFIMHPDYRSAGFGRMLWHLRRDLLRARLQPGASIGMDGVVAMQPFYAKGGFEPAFRDERYMKTGGGYSLHPHVSAFDAHKHLQAVQAIDKHCFGFERNHFLAKWLNAPGHQTLVSEKGNEVKGFAVLRQTFEGFKIGPLFANDLQSAEQLYTSCLALAPGQAVFLDIPVINSAAVQLVKQHQATYVFECARMYHGKQPNTDISQTYGITTFELG